MADSNVANDDIAEGDSIYRPIESFEAWTFLRIDSARWNTHRALLESIDSLGKEKLARARNVAKRTAAIDTGAIEGLYDLDRGVTITIATQNALWEAAFQKEDERVRKLIESQLDAYDHVIDFATQRTPIAEAWIRELHVRLCSEQKTYVVHTLVGKQDHELTHGAYKNHPNHVRLANGKVHAYAPVDQTQSEMARLCDELRSVKFQQAHPVLQAAYAHHAFTRIHPFQDGNGRVARALASVFLYREASIPLLVLVEHRDEYFDRLHAADLGNIQVFADFVFSRSLDAFLLVNESFRAAEVPTLTESTQGLRSLLFTRGGFRHQEVDVAGQNLLALFDSELASQFVTVSDPNQLILGRGRNGASFPVAKSGYRNPVGTDQTLIQLSARAASPSTQSVNWNFYYQVPVDCGNDDLLVIRCKEDGNLEFYCPFSNIHPTVQTVARIQMSMFVQQVLARAIQELIKRSKNEFVAKGYLPKAPS